MSSKTGGPPALRILRTLPQGRAKTALLKAWVTVQQQEAQQELWARQREGQRERLVEEEAAQEVEMEEQEEREEE